MSVPHYYIKQHPTSNLYLESYDGTSYKWTTAKGKAWRFPWENAKRRLYFVQKTNANAVLTKV